MYERVGRPTNYTVSYGTSEANKHNEVHHRPNTGSRSRSRIERLHARPPHVRVDSARRPKDYALSLEVGALRIAASVGWQAALRL